MITKQTTLKCEYCKKEASFIGKRPVLPRPFRIEGLTPNDPPKNWYRIEPNYINSIWAGYDFVIDGDFCSIECMRDYIIKEIEERDNPPKTMWVGGVFSEVKCQP